jgi:predicted phosphoribosyltransferase
LDRALGTLPGHGSASVHRVFRGPLVFAPAQLIGAVPVSPPDALDRISRMADAVICLERPVDFRAIGQLYRHFPQVEDAGVVEWPKPA